MPDNHLHLLTDPEVNMVRPNFQVATVTGTSASGWTVRTFANTETILVKERIVGSNIAVNDIVVLMRVWNHRWFILGKLESK